VSSPDFFDDLERHLDRAAHRQARYGRLATAPIPSVNAVLAAVVVALIIGAGAYAIPHLIGSDAEVTSPPTPVPSPSAPDGIIVTPDVIRLGDGLIGEGVTKEDGRLYVLAGHYKRATDRLRAPETAALVAFDDAGTELWRTELDRRPDNLVVVDGDPWVTLGDQKTVVKIDGSDGRILGDGRLRGDPLWAFGSLWVTTIRPVANGNGPGRMVRMDPDDLRTTAVVDVPLFQGDCHTGGVEPADDEGWCPGRATVGADAIWMPLKDRGVARIDPDTNEVTVIGVDEIGHEVLQVAVDGGVVYVASFDQVSSIVDGKVVATVSTGPIGYLGPVDGAFGMVDPATRRLQVLRANDPMVVESRQISVAGHPGGTFEMDGEAWEFFGENYSARRIKLLP
jgi:hypothetical protein